MQKHSTAPQNGLHMRATNIISLLASGIAACSMLGCGQENIKGQVFIVTRSAENIKLGLVDVLLLDEQSVATFLQREKPAVEREVSLRADNVRKAKHELQEAQDDLEKFQKTDEAFRPAFLQLKFQFNQLKQEIQELEDGPFESMLALQKRLDEVGARMKSTQSTDELMKNVIEINKLSGEIDAIQQKQKDGAPELEAKKARYVELEKQITAVSVPSDGKLHALSDRVSICSATLDRCRTAMESFPNIQFYFSDPLPVPCQKAVTDADGRFEMKVPRMKRFAVLAQSTRKVAADTERYIWFFWVPRDNDDTPLILSNNNLIFADYPGNILPIKPKAVD